MASIVLVMHARTGEALELVPGCCMLLPMVRQVVQPRCRVQFTAEDVDFIVAVLGKRVGTARALTRLLADEEARDLILDDETLFREILEGRGCLRISPRLYFYVLVRRVFRNAGLEDRALADYVAELLSGFAGTRRSQRPPSNDEPWPGSFVDMLVALTKADQHTAFLLHAHIGDTALFLCGMFPERIKARTERRGAPSLDYYEAIGKGQYRAASCHVLARRYEVDSVLDALSDQFQATRMALNEISDRIISLGEGMHIPDELLIPNASQMPESSCGSDG